MQLLVPNWSKRQSPKKNWRPYCHSLTSPLNLRFAAHMKAKIIITPKKAVLDPQGKTVQNALDHMGYKGVGAVHVGKYLEIELPDGDKETWRKQIDDACHKILSNPVIEDYKFEIE
jgi:phosphoribosylformylglycinamidine synthase subunit PurS